MTRRRILGRISRHILLSGLPIALLAATLALPTTAFAQRDGGRGGDRGGDRGGGRDSSPSPRRDYSPPARDRSPGPGRDYSPRRDYSPPARDNTPRRDYSPPARDNAFPRRDYTPSRDYSSPRRDPAPTGRDYTGPIRQYRPSGSDTSPRRYSYTPQRDSSPTRPGVEPFTRRDNPAPRRDSFQNDRRSGSQDRTGPARSTGDARPRDFYDYRRNQGFDRSRPGGRDGQDRIGNNGSIGRTPDRQRFDPQSRRSDGRGFEPAPRYNRAHDIFTRSQEGRRFENGIRLRPGGYIADNRVRRYFSHGYSYYPYYAPSFQVGFSYWSPYGYYFGVCPPYIYRSHVWLYPPPVVYIEIPIYSGDRCVGYGDGSDDYYLSSDRYVSEPGLADAIDQIREAFRTGNVQSLVELTDPNVKIAIFMKGKYEYSVSADDYLDMTRDALSNTDTITFDLYRVHRRAAGVYVVSGRHIYRAEDGSQRSVYVSYVLERIGGRWTITQIGTAPDRIQEP